MSITFLSAAEVSNIVSTLSVLFSFCLMIVFIIRHILQGRPGRNDLNNTYPVSIQIPRLEMVPIRIPFTFKLLEVESSSFTTLSYSVSSEIPYKMGVYWGVDIKALHFFLRRPWRDIIAAFDGPLFFEGNYQSSKLSTGSSHPEIKNTSSYTNEKPLSLGNAPRPCYPLVIILIQSNVVESLEENQVALINIIHIKDSVCTLPTCVLARYLKQSHGQLACLKQLYLSAGGPLEEDTPVPMAVPQADDISPYFSSPVMDVQGCIVCQYCPLSRVLLPCRHTCVCAKCFIRLDRCPICRAPISSYFCIRNEDYVNQ